MTVARHDPSSNSTMTPTSAPAVAISCMTSEMESFTNVDASSRSLMRTPCRGDLLGTRDHLFDASTTSRVDASVLFIATIITVCLPLTSTAFCCTGP